MQLDFASCKMAYAAARDNFMDGYGRAVTKSTANVPAQFRDAFLRGRMRGLNDALQFEPIDGGTPPPELDEGFAQAWKVGYEHGHIAGAEYRIILLKRIS